MKSVRFSVTVTFYLDDDTYISIYPKRFGDVKRAVDYALGVDLAAATEGFEIENLSDYWRGEVELGVVYGGETMYREIVKDGFHNYR